jgi:hypothetical protein
LFDQNSTSSLQTKIPLLLARAMQESLNNINLTNMANPPGSIFNRADSLRQRSTSSRRSISLSRMSSDRVLGSIRLSHELSDQILADVDSSALARIGDSGDRVVGEEEEMDGDFMAGHVSDEAFVGLEGLQSADAISPLAEDPILSASTKVNDFFVLKDALNVKWVQWASLEVVQ